MHHPEAEGVSFGSQVTLDLDVLPVHLYLTLSYFLLCQVGNYGINTSLLQRRNGVRCAEVPAVWWVLNYSFLNCLDLFIPHPVMGELAVKAHSEAKPGNPACREEEGASD